MDVSISPSGMKRTADPNHLPPPPLIALDERHDDWRSEITESGCDGTDNGDVTIICKFGNLGVVCLKDTKREGKAYIQFLLESSSVEFDS